MAEQLKKLTRHQRDSDDEQQQDRHDNDQDAQQRRRRGVRDVARAS